MKKPTEAIERMRRVWGDDLKEVLAYLDSIHEWPADLTRERLEELADEAYSGWSNRFDALRRLAELAPRKEKRMLHVYRVPNGGVNGYAISFDGNVHGWERVGGLEVDA